MDTSVQITWLGHSCFRLEYRGFVLILDPFEDDSVPGLKNIRETAHLVLCSHEHFDHNFRQGVTLLPTPAENPFGITAVQTFHDEVSGAKRGDNLVYVLQAGRQKIVHLGDLGHKLSPEQVQAIGKPDLLLLPIGGTYTVTAAEARAVADSLSPRVIIPMHYRGNGFGFDNIGTLDEFTGLCQNVEVYPGNTFVLTPQTPAQVAVLQPPR